MTDEEAAEFYRDKLADWMISQDIPTGSEGDKVEDLLEALATYISELRKEREQGEEPDAAQEG
jgi:hypothetical protein